MNDLLDKLDAVIKTGVTSADQANDLIVQCYNAITDLQAKSDKPKKRTTTQNAAMHKYFQLMAQALNDAGYSYSDFIELVEKKGNQVEWTESNFKETGWRIVQKAMFNKESTSDLDTHEVTKVYEVINSRFAELAGVSMVFPNWRG
jgi:sulfatase maturation enzyme AslB (radical SAM superfamily)